MNNDKSWCDCKNLKEQHVSKKGCFWNSATSSCENSEYAGSIIFDSVVIFHEIIDTKKSVPTKCTLTNFLILLSFLLITIALLIAISIYLIKH